MSLRHYLAVLALSGLCAAAVPAQADTLGAPSAVVFFNQATVAPHVPLSSSPFTATFSGPGVAANARISGGGDPAVTIGITNAQLPITAESYLAYQFEVSGPVGQMVPITIVGSGGVVVSDPSSMGASASLAIATVDSSIGQILVNDNACAGTYVGTYNCEGSFGKFPVGAFPVDQIFDIYTNTAYLVTMVAVVSGSGGTASAFVDPSITLDTTDPGYSLEFSPGLTAATPEPSSLLLLGTSLLGGTGAIRRRLVR